MLAARYYGRRDIRLEDVPIPSLEADDDVLVEVSWCGICGTDLHEYTAGPIVTPVHPHPATGATLPQTLGHEFSARVVEVGKGVTSVKVGDRASIMPLITCGRCYYCRRGLGQHCLNFACTGLSAQTGGLAQYAVVRESQLGVLPDEVSDLEGAVVEPACVAAYGVDRAGVVGGDVVLVTGAGPIGVLSAMYAGAVGAATVIVAEPNANRADLARSLDIGEVVDPTADGFAELIADRTDGIGVDLAVECSGTGPGLTTCMTSVRRRAAVVQTGLHTKPAGIDGMMLAEREVSLIGSWCYWLHDWPRVIRMVASGKYPIGRLVTTQLGLPDVVTKGFDVLVDPQGDQLKVLVSSAR
jgi:(R,R)-butanediol dehydrogenase/meso-butanediol dehydrogenase/diacetyl reductase